MSELWLLLQSPASNAATNMAMDEALLRDAAQRRLPLLRVYAWAQPAVSVGYFQNFPTDLAPKYEIVRRPTGGGVVYHGNDTTYTVVVPPGHPLYEMPTAAAYRALHRAVATALGQGAELCDSVPSLPRGQYECFQRPMPGDVVAGGKKLAGAAQRRTKHGMLHQGSIAANVSADQLQSGFHKTFQAEFQPYELLSVEKALAERLAREKYATDAWNRKVQHRAGR